MAEKQTGWTERKARPAHERVVESRRRASRQDRAQLRVEASLEDVVEPGFAAGRLSKGEETGHAQVLRAAVNDLQHRLLTADPQTDVYGLALGRLVTAARADRVCAFRNRKGADGRMVHELYAESVVSPELSLMRSETPASMAYEDLLPGLLERLAAGEAFSSRTEFLPRSASKPLAAQAVEAVILLPLFVGGAFHGFVRLDRCDSARLWSEDEIGILVSAAGSISAAMERQQVVTKLVQRSHELAALLATSRAISSSIDYDVVLREVASAAAEALGCPRAVIWEYSGRGDLATYRVLYEAEATPGAAESLAGTSYYGGDHPGGMRAVREGVVAQQLSSDPALSSAARARMAKLGEKTWLSVPLVYKDEVLGMMILAETARERRFTRDEVRMGRVIGEQAAAALHNARLHRREEDQHRWLAALAEATRVIASRLDRDELLRDVARLATEALLVEQAHVYEWDELGGAFSLCACAGEHAAVSSHGPPPVDGAVTQALLRGELVFQRREGTGGSPRNAAGTTGDDGRGVVWVPFRMEDETLGAMRLVDRLRENRFGDGEVSFARALGEHAAIALNNARLYAQIEAQATRDGLTGLANHRCFYDRLAEEFERARRYGQPLALLMLDIDDFKKLNDTYGHPAGDEVLRLIGRLLREELRSGGDLAARYGGEEFSVILPNSGAPKEGGVVDSSAVRDPVGAQTARTAQPAEAGPCRGNGAAALAERLRRRIATAEFPIGSGGRVVHVTVSIGVASYPRGAASMEELVEHADMALYAAKRAGKDRVAVCRER
jgi:diguanylate cyclase (GGDEF)-like protein